MFWVSLAGVVAVVVYTLVSGYQACISKKQLNALIDQIAFENPPKIEVTLVAANPINHPGGKLELHAGAKIEGTVVVFAEGGGDTTINNAICMTYILRRGQKLPMWRPYDTGHGDKPVINCGSLVFNSASPEKRKVYSTMHPGDLAVWDFIYTIPATYRRGDTFYILGQIGFNDDRVKTAHIVDFARHYDPSKNRFAPENNPDYEHTY